MAAGSGDLARLWDRETELAEISRELARAHGGAASRSCAGGETTLPAGEVMGTVTVRQVP